MKTIVLFLACLTPAFVVAQDYSLDWHRVAGGGGVSTGGVFSVCGTIGQPDAGGPMTGGNYSLTGGFWSLFAVQTPGAPRLTIRLLDSTRAAISWPSPSTGFVLQQHTNLGTTNWTNLGTTPTDDGANKTVTVSPPAGNGFYRLSRQ